MVSENISANLKADVSLSANKSQALPLALIGLSAISLIAGFVFLAIEPGKCWLPIALAVTFCIGGAVLWWRSHKSSEFEGSSTTEIIDSERGLRVSTDSRALESPMAIQHLAGLLTQVAHRSPLPEPDGMIDMHGIPQPHRKLEAQSIVNQANSEAQSIVQVLTQLIGPEGQAISPPTFGNMESEPEIAKVNLPLES
jgi:hypothetical protein